MSEPSNTSMIKIIKRSGQVEAFNVSKIQTRIEALTQDLPGINMPEIVGLTAVRVHNGITTEELDASSAEIAATRSIVHNSYAVLASRIAVSNLHKSTPGTFSAAIAAIQAASGVFSPRMMQFVAKHATQLDAIIDHRADYKYGYLALCVMRHGYLYHTSHKRWDDTVAAPFIAAGVDVARVRECIASGVAPPISLPPGMFDTFGDSEREWLEATPLPEQLVAALWKSLPSVRKYLDRPQYALMRMAICVNLDTKYPIENIKTMYQALSSQKYTHGTSTVVNAGSINQQLLNCFLLSAADSTEGILQVLSDAAIISRGSGGEGICLDAIRAKGQIIKSTGGAAAGTVRVAKMLSEVALTWNQGGRRPGAFAEYLTVHHGDIMDFLIQGLQTTTEENRATSLFRGCMLTEHFYGRWKRDEMYSLFSEDTAPGLMYLYDGMRVCDTCGWCPNPNYARYVTGPRGELCAEHTFTRVDAYTALYTRYEREYRYVARVPARDIVDAICRSKLGSQGPYLLNKDAINRRSKQDPSGTITMSNLCAEIVEYSTPDSPACCTLASVALQNFVMNGGSFDFVELMRVVEIAIESLDKIVDCNSYPTEGSRKNNMYFRPLGLGVQGLADAFRLLRIPFLSPRAEQLDMLIHEAMYFAALSTTCRLAQKLGPCPAWNDGAIDTTAEYHLWMEDMKRIGGEFAGVDPRRWKVGAPGLLADFPVTGAMWDALEADVKRYGVRNTYLRANMPTVNTGDIIGSSGPSTEPVNYNAFNKTTVGSNKMVKFDTNMIKHLTELGVWDAGLANAVATDPFGRLPELARPGWDDIKEIYLTIYEMKQSALFRRAGMRQAFIDQTQSFNQFLSSRDMTVLRGVIELGFKYGLKTISYYTRMPPAKDAGKNIVWERPQVCSRDNPDCVACQS